jgi:xanthine/CO dehydrogenase XdhC/CoxF family maturation factor
MTKEITDIIAAFKAAQKQGRQTALATVVHVEGSSYRRPGARMLVEDNGRLTGAISGGCLEGDALRKALLTINQKQNKLVTYNTLDDDDVQFGVQLGCNGIVHILFEPIDATKPNNPIVLLERCLDQRKNAVLVTLFSPTNSSGMQPGTCLFFNGEEKHSNGLDEGMEASIASDAAAVLSTKTSLTKTYKDGALKAFVELVEPTISLVIVGAGNDAMPVVEMANILGWQTTIIDGRSTHLQKQRFPKADRLLLGKPVEISNQLSVDERTVFVLMTHNYNFDREMLGILLQRKCSYIGTLGPKKRLERMLAELAENGLMISAEQRAVIYGPTGLDIGAETAEEIALSLLAEIKAVMMKRPGTSLRDRVEAIHSRPESSINVE